MTENEIVQLVSEIEVGKPEIFWRDSPTLNRAASSHDPRVVCALAIQHHCFGNKQAFSAHVIRQAIRVCDGPELPTLWRGIDSEENSSAIVDRMEDFDYLPWASTFIIGEIGGAQAFANVTKRLSAEHSPRHYLLVRLLSHLLVRYLSIEKEGEPQSTMIDLRTGEAEKVLSRYHAEPLFDMTSRKRLESNELFTPVSRSLIEEARTKLSQVPDSLLNTERGQFFACLDHIRASNARRGIY